jgi:hypothetical protein
MPTTIATRRGAPLTGARRTTYGFIQSESGEVMLAVWVISVLLMGAIADFGARSTFPGAFDVSVAAF